MHFTLQSLHTAQSFALLFGIFSIKCLPCRRSLPFVMEFLPSFLAFLFQILFTNCRTRFFRNALCVTFFSPCSLLLMLYKIKLLTIAADKQPFVLPLKSHYFIIFPESDNFMLFWLTYLLCNIIRHPFSAHHDGSSQMERHFPQLFTQNRTCVKTVCEDVISSSIHTRRKVSTKL